MEPNDRFVTTSLAGSEVYWQCISFVPLCCPRTFTRPRCAKKAHQFKLENGWMDNSVYQIKSNQNQNQNYFIYPRGEIQLVCLLLN